MGKGKYPEVITMRVPDEVLQFITTKTLEAQIVSETPTMVSRTWTMLTLMELGQDWFNVHYLGLTTVLEAFLEKQCKAAGASHRKFAKAKEDEVKVAYQLGRAEAFGEALQAYQEYQEMICKDEEE